MVKGFEIGRDGPSRILVCVDGTPTSLRAGAYAAGLARRQDSELIVCFVATAPALTALTPAVTGALDQALAELTAELRGTLEDAAANLGIRMDFHGVRGDPYTEITRLAERQRVDAVVVGASGVAAHKLLTSLAVRLVRAGRWPVTVVP
jgi:nucleotide-binding universal stress UspA family protein